jgi:DNA-binding PadR family transcriptional regulator
MKPIGGDQLRGHLESLILAVLEDGPSHGWDICRRLDATSRGALALKEGSVYPALYRLERQGLVTAQWVDEPARRRGPRRRVYRLSPKGRRALVTARDQWQHFTAIVTNILGAPA